MNNAQEFCDTLLEKYKLDIGNRFFEVQFNTNMVPLVYIKYAGVDKDAKLSEMMAARRKVQYMVYGFNADGSLKDTKVTASPTIIDNSLSNITGSLEHVANEICKVLDKFIL